MPTSSFARSLLLPSLAAVALPAAAQTQVAPCASARDNTLYAIANGSLSNGAGEAMFTGFTFGGELRRAVVAFDLAAIPPGSVVTGVAVQLFVTMTTSAPGDVSLHRALADWGEGTSVAGTGGGGGGSGAPATAGDVTWLHRFHPNVPWTVAGGEFAPGASATLLGSGAGFHVWTSTPRLVADVQAWVDQAATNFGWFVMTPETPNDRTRRIATREHTVPSERPLLTVTYVPPGVAAFVGSGGGCAGAAGVPSLAAAAGSSPVLGTTFQLAVTNVPAATPLVLGIAGFSTIEQTAGAYPLPLELGVIGMPGCSQRVSTDVVVALAASGGSAPWVLPIPPSPLLTGFTFHVQALVPDAGVNAFGATTSDAGTAIVGT